MKKLILTCSFVAAAAVVSFGQNVQPATQSHAVAARPSSFHNTAAVTPEAAAEKTAKAVQAKYKLTADQYKTIYNAELSYEQQDRAARTNGQLPGPGQSMQMNMGRDQTYQQVLTADQYAKYQAAKPSPASKK